ncbi:MAG: helix-turn-helix domain-containing protein [Oscillospiraceae bacterium]|nr:helix-turn-helix domain-containing protein [Oscillospiraceae bacterium]
MNQNDYTIALHLTQEQYEKLEAHASERGVSVDGYALYKVLHETEQLPLTQKLLLTPDEARKLLGIGRTVMYRILKEGIIPAVKLSGSRRLYIPMEGLKKMIAARTAAPFEIGGEVNE